MSHQPTPFQTAYRLTIMVGTLSCVSMAALRYGPEPGELADAIDRLASMVVETPDPDRVEATSIAPLAVAPASELDQLQAPTPMFNSAAPAAPRYDPAVSQASALTPVESFDPPAGDLEQLDRERLTAPLLAMGATRADVTTWGRGDVTVYRATASAPVGEAPGGLQRHFDAVGPTPEAAVERLAEEVRAASLR